MRRGSSRRARPSCLASSGFRDTKLSPRGGRDPQNAVDDASRGTVPTSSMAGPPPVQSAGMANPLGGFSVFPLVGIAPGPTGNGEKPLGHNATGGAGFSPPGTSGAPSKGPFYVKNTFLSTSADGDHRSRTESCDAVLEGCSRVREAPLAPPETVLEIGESGEASISEDAAMSEGREARLSENGLSLFGVTAERYALVEAFHKESLDAAFDYIPYPNFRGPLPFASPDPNTFKSPDHSSLSRHDPSSTSSFLFDVGRLSQMSLMDDSAASLVGEGPSEHDPIRRDPMRHDPIGHEFPSAQVDFGTSAQVDFGTARPDCSPRLNHLDDLCLSPELGRQVTPPQLSPMASSRTRTFVSRTGESASSGTPAVRPGTQKPDKDSRRAVPDVPSSGASTGSPMPERRKASRKAVPTPGSDVQSRDVNEENEKAASGGWTTIMLRNIPNKYTQKMLLDVINLNFSGLYDFFYLPIDFRNKCNVGYAFINFIHWHYAVMFKEQFDGLRLGAFKSNKVCEVSWGRVQGLAANIEHYRNSAVMSIPIAEYKPMLFKNGIVVPFPEADGPLPLVKLRPQKC